MELEQMLLWLRERLESDELGGADRDSFTAAVESLTATGSADGVTERLVEPFEPLVERAVRRDGTVPIKMIGPGWGSSGFYGRSVLERDVPRAFPAGTHMYWNHDTAVEAADRPEGDLKRLAAVTLSEPRWLENGPKGEGMYADALVASPYREAVDEIGEHIGVSIYALNGIKRMGEADGRKGPIIDGILPSKRNSVDFVTKPGAGGAIVSLFESAGTAVLPEPGERERLQEAANVGEWLESRLHLVLTQIADDMFGEGRLTRVERKALSGAIGQALDAYHTAVSDNAPQLYERGPWDEAPDDSGMDDGSGDDLVNESLTEVEMGELDDLRTALTEANGRADAQQAELDRMREALLLRDARDFVAGRLAEAGLPDLTSARLLRELVSSPPVADGRLDEAAFGELVTTAVEAAQAEVAAVIGNGRIEGMGSLPSTGSGGGSGADAPKLEESDKRIKEALADLV